MVTPHRAYDVTVRRIEDADIAAVQHLLREAYGRPIAMSLRSRIAVSPDDWVVAQSDGALVGVVAAARFGSVAYIGSMGVLPSAQRRGVATELMRVLLARLDATAVGTILLDATDAGAPLYEKFGFADLDVTHVVAREARGRPPSGVRPPVDGAALARAAAIDAAAAGGDRRLLLATLARESYAALTVRPGGYALVREYVLGPVVGESAETARIVIDAALGASPWLTRAFVPGVNVAALRMLDEHGFATSRTLRHMGRGEPSPMRRDAIYAQASLAHG